MRDALMNQKAGSSWIPISALVGAGLAFGIAVAILSLLCILFV